MSQSVKLMAALIVIAIAIIGCLLIFGVIDFGVAFSNLAKIVGAIVLLIGCAALIAVVMRDRN